MVMVERHLDSDLTNLQTSFSQSWGITRDWSLPRSRGICQLVDEKCCKKSKCELIGRLVTRGGLRLNLVGFWTCFAGIAPHAANAVVVRFARGHFTLGGICHRPPLQWELQYLVDCIPIEHADDCAVNGLYQVTCSIQSYSTVYARDFRYLTLFTHPTTHSKVQSMCASGCYFTFLHEAQTYEGLLRTT